jgi:hypothetical protein
MDPDLSVCDWHCYLLSSEIKSVESIHLAKNGLFGNISGSIYELDCIQPGISTTLILASGINKAKNLSIQSRLNFSKVSERYRAGIFEIAPRHGQRLWRYFSERDNFGP